MKRTLVLSAILVMLLVGLSCALCASDWGVVDSWFRYDENHWAKKQVWDGFYWSEGWWDVDEQFYPKYFKQSGSMHITLKNNTSNGVKIFLADVDGEPLEKIVTNRDQAGRIVWWNMFPSKTNLAPAEIKPGGWVECIIRLRTKPQKDVKVGFVTDGGRVEVTVPIKPRKTRLESVSFSPKTDRVYLYTRNLDGSMPEVKSIRLDGKTVKAEFAQGPAKSGLLFADVGLQSPWKWGTYHLIEVTLADGTNLTYPARAWDSYFTIGLFGDVKKERVQNAVKNGFNTYVTTPADGLLDELGVNYMPVVTGTGRERTATQSGRLFYYNKDEPDGADATDAVNLPFMDRLGFYAQPEVLARYWEQYDRTPATPAMVLVNNTYKPLNYYVYGQTCDVFCTDPYVPLGGDQLDYVAHALRVARDASAPNPQVVTLWACGDDISISTPNGRVPDPEEERMMAFYAIGCGIKGLTYFADRDGRDGEPTGVSHNKPLWEEIGRINADVKALAPYLAVSCPAGAPEENEDVWKSSLMCGSKNMLVVVVNKKHHIGYNTRHGFPWHNTAENVTISVLPPSHFKNIKISEVVDGKLVPHAFKMNKDKVEMTLEKVSTGRAFVVTSN